MGRSRKEARLKSRKRNQYRAKFKARGEHTPTGPAVHFEAPPAPITARRKVLVVRAGEVIVVGQDRAARDKAAKLYRRTGKFRMECDFAVA